MTSRRIQRAPSWVVWPWVASQPDSD